MTHSELENAPPTQGTRAAPPTNAATRETLEDYTLRFAPRSYRRWSTGVVATSALGGIAYLADFAIGANIGISYGTTKRPGPPGPRRAGLHRVLLTLAIDEGQPIA